MKKLLIRVVVSTLILLVAAGGMVALARSAKPPAQTVPEERPLPVQALRVTQQDVPVVISGFGTARALDTVSITPEVPGRVVEIHPRLESGETIAKGDLLFAVDPRDYEARVARAQAQVAQLSSALDLLRKQQSLDTERLVTAERSLALQKEDFDRVRNLFEQDEVGTRSGVDQKEIAMNQTREQRDLLAQQVALYPSRIAEAQAGLEAARADLSLAQVSLERARVVAPFDARVTMANIEVGQYITPGAPVLALANDTMLEISVPIDSIEARRWLRFTEQPSAEGTAWFNQVEPVVCTIHWTEEPDAHAWTGKLDRVEAFNPETRMMTVAVRVEGADAISRGDEALPLVDGMFCRVDIPGKTMSRVVALPRWAVSFERTAYIVDAEGRLQLRKDLEVARTQGETTYVSSGLAPGETVVVTRLVNPLLNSLLEVQEIQPGELDL